MRTIATSLVEYAADEGLGTAMDKAERMRDTIEEMLEITSGTSERIAGRVLLESVHKALTALSDKNIIATARSIANEFDLPPEKHTESVLELRERVNAVISPRPGRPAYNRKDQA